MNKLVILVVIVVFIFLLTYDPKSKKLEKYITTPQVAAPAVQSEPTCSEDRYYKLQFAKNAPRDVCTGHPVEYLGAVMQA